jgi:hypothetical protein
LPIVLSVLCLFPIELFVLLSFVYCPLYCLSFYPLSIAHCRQ